MNFLTKSKHNNLGISLFALFFLGLVHSGIMYSSEIVSLHFESECNRSEYFSVDFIKCVYCDPSKSVVPSENKQSCVCTNFSHKSRWSKEENPICINCKPGEVATKDGKYCVPCGNTSVKTRTKQVECKNCSSNEISVERSIDGSLLPLKECIQCAPGTRPSNDKTWCVPCLISNISGHNDSCSCPQNSHELLGPDICAAHSELAAWPDDSATFTVDYPLSNKLIQSRLLRENLRRDVHLCKSQRRNSACQSVANMCVLTHFKDGPACSLFRDFKHIPSSEREPYPWLYYGDGDAPTVLNRRKITNRYSLNPNSELRWLNLTATKWSMNGTWLGMSTIKGAGLQVCAGDWNSQNAAFRFGTRYSQECKIRASQLLSSHRQTEFFSLYLQFDSFLYALPALDTSYQHGNRFPNRESDIGQWQLTRRFFLLDTVSGLPVNGNKVEVIQYLKSATLRYNPGETMTVLKF